MEMKVPFQQLLSIVETLTPNQKAKLRSELGKDDVEKEQQDDFIEYLLNGPVYDDKDIQMIEENRKSIDTWRTKS